MNASPHDTDLTAWWCENLPRFTAHAVEHRWRQLLDSANDDILAGASVRDALAARDLDLAPDDETDDPGAHKGWTGPADLGGLTDRLPVLGAYTCPAPTRRCGRLANADPATGYEPRCDLHHLPMTLQAPPNRSRP